MRRNIKGLFLRDRRWKRRKSMKNGRKSMQQVCALMRSSERSIAVLQSYFYFFSRLLVLWSSGSFSFVLGLSSCCDFRFVVSALESQFAIKFFDFFSEAVIPTPASSKSTFKHKWASLFFTFPTLFDTGCQDIWNQTKKTSVVGWFNFRTHFKIQKIAPRILNSLGN